jgi:hypothetical protein
MLEMQDNVPKGTLLKKKSSSAKNLISTVELMMPRDVLNVNTLLSSQLNLNKYAWETDGDKVI